MMMKGSGVTETPSERLQKGLRNNVSRNLRVKRPMLAHLNADTSWLIRLPYPSGSSRSPGRSFYNIVLDPWFKGVQTDYSPWFSTQWHAIPSSVQSISELNEALKETEELAYESGVKSESEKEDSNFDRARKNWIDAVVVSYEFSDHMHKETLHEIDPTVPVFATEKAASIIQSWKHFNHVSKLPTNLLLPGKAFDWRSTAVTGLPSWIGISKIGKKRDVAYLHWALLLTFDLSGTSSGDGTAEAIIYTPHGIVPEDVEPIAEAQPSVETLVLLHGLHSVTISGAAQLNLGAHNGLKVQQVSKAKYWTGTHDEVKDGGGLISSLIRRKQLNIEDAIEKERVEKGYAADSDAVMRLKDVRFTDLGSGESLLLE